MESVGMVEYSPNEASPPRTPLRADIRGDLSCGPSSHHMGCGRMRQRKSLDGADNSAASRYAREFQELNLVGRGGFGAVYKARNRLDGNLYAVKKTQFQLHLKEAFTMRDKSDDFLSEVALLSKMDHPHVVRYYAAWLEEKWSTVQKEGSSLCNEGIFSFKSISDDTEEEEEEEMRAGAPCYCITVYMQMALYEDDNLMARILNQSRVVDSGTNLTVLVQILQGLHYVHSMSIIHRDIKPSNIFFNQDGTIKIGDFGLSIVDTSSGRSRCNSIDGHELLSIEGERDLPVAGSPTAKVLGGVGTAVYASPEQLEGRDSTFASDVFSIGVIMFELYHTPFYSTTERYITISQVRKGSIPANLQARYPEEVSIMERCLCSDPSRRPTCEQLLSPWGEDHSIAGLQQRLGGASLSTTPLCGSSTPGSNHSPAASVKSSPDMSPLVSPEVRDNAAALLNYLDYNLGVDLLAPRSGTASPAFALGLPHRTSSPPQLQLSMSAIRQAEASSSYNNLHHDELVETLLERDAQIDALQARMSRMEDQMLASNLAVEETDGQLDSPGLNFLF